VITPLRIDLKQSKPFFPCHCQFPLSSVSECGLVLQISHLPPLKVTCFAQVLATETLQGMALSSYAQVIVNVANENDNGPFFVQEVPPESIAENSPMNTFIGEVSIMSMMGASMHAWDPAPARSPCCILL
jgi:hypothetical protein